MYGAAEVQLDIFLKLNNQVLKDKTVIFFIPKIMYSLGLNYKTLLTFPSASFASSVEVTMIPVLVHHQERDYPNWSQNLALNGALWGNCHG